VVSTAVWAECNRRIQKSVLEEGDFLTIFEQLSNRMEAGDLELVAVVA
jgi:hypothetical protein